MKSLYFLIFSAIIVFSPFAFAFRCGHSLVDIGDYKADVLEKCGDPDYFDSHWERMGNINRANIGNAMPLNFGGQAAHNNFNYGQTHYQEVEVLIEEWTYDFGRHKFSQHLRFENGQLKSVQSVKRSR